MASSSCSFNVSHICSSMTRHTHPALRSYGKKYFLHETCLQQDLLIPQRTETLLLSLSNIFCGYAHSLAHTGLRSYSWLDVGVPVPFGKWGSGRGCMSRGHLLGTLKGCSESGVTQRCGKSSMLNISLDRIT